MRVVSIGILLILSLLCTGCETQQKDSGLNPQELKNAEIIRKLWADGVNKHNTSVFDSLLADDFVRYSDAMPPGLQELRGKDVFITALTGMFQTYPDWHEEILQLIVQGEKVAVVTRGTGTFSVPVADIEPTGKKGTMMAVAIFRLNNGKIAESWITWDNLNFMQQVGMPLPPALMQGKK